MRRTSDGKRRERRRREIDGRKIQRPARRAFRATIDRFSKPRKETYKTVLIVAIKLFAKIERILEAGSGIDFSSFVLSLTRRTTIESRSERFRARNLETLRFFLPLLRLVFFDARNVFLARFSLAQYQFRRVKKEGDRSSSTKLRYENVYTESS